MPLKRSLSLPLIALYGIGTILGAGVYVLVGKIIGISGTGAVLSFFFAGLLAGISAFSYMELTARFPKSSGEALYIYEGFHSQHLATVIGLLIACAGIVSCATMVHGFVGYFKDFFHAPDTAIMVLVVVGLGLIAFWGIDQSAWFAAAVATLEIAGLIVIIVTGFKNWTYLPAHLGDFLAIGSFDGLKIILAGSFVAFYAFIGFEDMVNVAEEVIDPQKNLPKAILIALVGSTFLYMLIAITCLLTLPIEIITQSKTPLSTVFVANTGYSTQIISLISLFAIINGGLVQIIMSSRILYGLASQGWFNQRFNQLFSRVHTKTLTPHIATLAVIAVTLIFTLWFPLIKLAKATSFFTLSVFIFINLSLYRIKKNPQSPAFEGPNVPSWVPVTGAITSIAFLVIQFL